MMTATLTPPEKVLLETAAEVPPHSNRQEIPKPDDTKRLVVEADEIVFKAGKATITLSKSSGGIVEIHAPQLRLTGTDILSEATESNTTAGRRVVSEALSVTELLGRLVRVDGQCVKIS